MANLCKVGSSKPLMRKVVGWEAGTRTPIARFRVWSPTIGRPPSKGNSLYELLPGIVNQLKFVIGCGRRVLRGFAPGTPASLFSIEVPAGFGLPAANYPGTIRYHPTREVKRPAIVPIPN